MQELIQKLITEAGLSTEQADKTVSTIVGFIKQKFPPLADSIENMLAGKAPNMNNKSSFMDKASGIANEAKDKLEDFAEEAKDKLEDFAEEAKEKLSEAADKAEDFAKDAFNKIKGFFGGGDDKKEDKA
jgi:hypothetical protein